MKAKFNPNSSVMTYGEAKFLIYAYYVARTNSNIRKFKSQAEALSGESNFNLKRYVEIMSPFIFSSTTAGWWTTTNPAPKYRYTIETLNSKPIRKITTIYQKILDEEMNWDNGKIKEIKDFVNGYNTIDPNAHSESNLETYFTKMNVYTSRTILNAYAYDRLQNIPDKADLYPISNCYPNNRMSIEKFRFFCEKFNLVRHKLLQISKPSSWQYIIAAEYMDELSDDEISGYLNSSMEEIKKQSGSSNNADDSISNNDFNESDSIEIKRDTEKNNVTDIDLIKKFIPFYTKRYSLYKHKYVGCNLLVYGAPGTGKSHYVKYSIANGMNCKSNRVVFYPDYSYYDFVGAYKPVPLYDVNKTECRYVNASYIATNANEELDRSVVPGSPVIDYQYVPGPFVSTLIKACKHKENMYYLIIEELNRANAAAVFGDIFQLLDRTSDGDSEYGVKPSMELAHYLQSQGLNLKHGEIRIPKNMSIIATMNSADQGVSYLDSAFKRRWDFEYMKIDTSSIDDNVYLRYGGRNLTYRSFIDALNLKLRSYHIGEDRLIGPWFVDLNSLSVVGEDEGSNVVQQKYILDKLLLYLWDDVLRYKREDAFSVDSFTNLLDEFAEKDVLKLIERDDDKILRDAIL